MAIEFGYIKEYCERGFGRISKELYPSRYSQNTFFHIKTVKRKYSELAQTIDNGNWHGVSFWYVIERTSKGEQVSDLWSKADEVPSSLRNPIVSQVEEFWRDLRQDIPHWLDKITLELLGQESYEMLRKEREKRAREQREAERSRLEEERRQKVESERQIQLQAAKKEAARVAEELRRKQEIERQRQELARVEAERQLQIQPIATSLSQIVQPDITQEDVGPDPENPESKHAYELMQGASSCIFITGKAGTGKSHLLRHFIQKTKKRAVLLAPTGLAALNIGGQTIHSFFHFPPHIINLDDITLVRERELYRRVDTIVIDEVSMVNANLMDAIDVFMRKNGRDSSKPFGGAQIILFGDLFQLPPIITSRADNEFFSFHYASVFFFDARVFRELPIQVVELQKNYRQNDRAFIELLNAVRTNQLSDSQQVFLNSRYNPTYVPPDNDFFITLTTTNQRADTINTSKLRSLCTEEYAYTGEIEGKFDSFPTDSTLKLRKGAQVMFARNDTNKRWVNGTFGRVAGLDKGHIEVEVPSNGYLYTYRVEKETWEKLRYKFSPDTGRIATEVIGKFTQYPIKLAWAITIHKSQGQTFDKIIIDLTGGAFEHGQVYVALSRCRTLEGMVLKTEIWRNDILKVQSRVIEFMSQICLT